MFHYEMRENKYLLVDDSGEITTSNDEIAIAFDKTGILLKHGNPKMVKNYYDTTVKVFQEGGCTDIAKDLVLITGKFPVEELNKILDCCDYIGRFYKKLMEVNNE